MSDDGRSVIVLRWYDDKEVATLGVQGWFNQLRTDLNSRGKVKLSLGVFSYEQSGTDEGMGAKEKRAIASRLLDSTEPLTPDEFYKQLRGMATEQAGAVFQPSFVVVEGVSQLLFNQAYWLHCSFSIVAKELGYILSDRSYSYEHLEHSTFEKAYKTLMPLAQSLVTEDVFNRLLVANHDVERDLVSISHMGMPYLHGLLMKDTAVVDDRSPVRVAYPRDYAKAIHSYKPFFARVAGWLEIGDKDYVFLRAVAIGSRDVVREVGN